MRLSIRPILVIAMAGIVSADMHGQTRYTSAQTQTETWRFALTRMTDGYPTRYIDVGELACNTDSITGRQSDEMPICTFQVLYSTQGRFYVENPVFSPIDNNQLAYTGNDGELYSVDLLDMQSVQITSDEIALGGTAWSADSEWLLFEVLVHNSNNMNLSIKAVRSDGSSEPVIVSPGDIDAISPTWSPSGDAFAYVTSTFEEGELVVSQLSDPSVTRVLTGVSRPIRVRWSPVDDRLAVLNENEQTGKLELVTIHSDDSNRQFIRVMFPDIADFEWAPDGRAIFYTVTNFLYRIDLETGEDAFAYANLSCANCYRSDGLFALARLDAVAAMPPPTGEPAPSPTP